ncbi:MAG: glutathione S-transferase C-terminal domain-containing protein [Sphingopyxis sp.]
MTTLFGWGAMFGSVSPSPYVIKADVQMQMLGLAFDRRIADLASVPKGKAPYVEDDGAIIEDTFFIRQHFEAKLGVDLNAGLSDTDRAHAWAFERMLENHLAWFMVHERWVEGDNFERGPVHFFAGIPEPMRAEVVASMREQVKNSIYGHGIGRHSRAERMQLAARDIAATAALLDDKPFMLADHVTALDAAAYGVLACCAAPIFESELPAMIAAHANLSAYLGRMQARFFAQDRWPPMV